MSVEDYFDIYGFGEDEQLPDTCKYCGETPLWWGMTAAGGWRLFDEDDEQHVCEIHRRNADEELETLEG